MIGKKKLINIVLSVVFAVLMAGVACSQHIKERKLGILKKNLYNAQESDIQSLKYVFTADIDNPNSNTTTSDLSYVVFSEFRETWEEIHSRLANVDESYRCYISLELKTGKKINFSVGYSGGEDSYLVSPFLIEEDGAVVVPSGTEKEYMFATRKSAIRTLFSGVQECKQML